MTTEPARTHDDITIMRQAGRYLWSCTSNGEHCWTSDWYHTIDACTAAIKEHVGEASRG